MRKTSIFFGAGVALLAAAPLNAGGVAGCIGMAEGRDGVVSFPAYTLARSDEPHIGPAQLRSVAEADHRAAHPGQELRCAAYAGSGYFVVVDGSVEINGEMRRLIGFGFGPSREEALESSDDNLENIFEYRAYRSGGGQLGIVEEGVIDS